jgi:hypothetical protein
MTTINAEPQSSRSSFDQKLCELSGSALIVVTVAP